MIFCAVAPSVLPAVPGNLDPGPRLMTLIPCKKACRINGSPMVCRDDDPGVYDPAERARQKHAAREQHDARLQDGEVGRDAAGRGGLRGRRCDSACPGGP